MKKQAHRIVFESGGGANLSEISASKNKTKHTPPPIKKNFQKPNQWEGGGGRGERRENMNTI